MVRVVQPAFQGGLFFQPVTAGRTQQQLPGGAQREGQAREALRFMFSPSGSMFREFLLGARLCEPRSESDPRHKSRRCSDAALALDIGLDPDLNL